MIVDRIEGAGADKCFDRAPIDHALVDALAEVEQILEAAALARLEYRIDRLLAGTLDGAQPVADGGAIDRREAVGPFMGSIPMPPRHGSPGGGVSPPIGTGV